MDKGACLDLSVSYESFPKVMDRKLEAKSKERLVTDPRLSFLYDKLLKKPVCKLLGLEI